MVNHDELTTSDESYTYDDNGNRTNDGYTVDPVDKNNRMSSDGTYTYEYDQQGNREFRYKPDGSDRTEYEWDHRNRLTKVTYKEDGTAVDWVVDYTYDAQDRLISRAATGTDTTYTVYQGDHAYLKIDEASGGTKTISERYLYGTAVDQILAVEDDASAALWGLGDHQGSIRDVVDDGEGTFTPLAGFFQQRDPQLARQLAWGVRQSAGALGSSSDPSHKLLDVDPLDDPCPAASAETRLAALPRLRIRDASRISPRQRGVRAGRRAEDVRHIGLAT